MSEARCDLMVLMLSPSDSLISLLLLPSAISCTIARSRGDKSPSDFPWWVERKESSSCSETLPVKNGLCSASDATAAMNTDWHPI